MTVLMLRSTPWPSCPGPFHLFASQVMIASMLALDEETLLLPKNRHQPLRRVAA
jgi:hypothetical protein